VTAVTRRELLGSREEDKEILNVVRSVNSLLGLYGASAQDPLECYCRTDVPPQIVDQVRGHTPDQFFREWI